MGWVRWTVAGWCLLSLALAGALGPRGADAGSRQDVGALSAQGDVRVRETNDATTDADGSQPVTGSRVALLERTIVQTGADGAALLTLTNDGLVGLRAAGALRVGAAGPGGLRVDLMAGEALVRIPPGSRLTLGTSAAIIGAGEPAPVSTGTAKPAEASVRVLRDGQTVVAVRAGTLRVEGQQGGPALLRAGEQATFAQNTTPQIIPAGPPAAKPAAKRTIFGMDTRLAALVGFGGVALVGGAVGGGIAAAGGSSSSSESPAAGEGSPFKPHPRHPRHPRHPPHPPHPPHP